MKSYELKVQLLAYIDEYDTERCDPLAPEAKTFYVQYTTYISGTKQIKFADYTTARAVMRALTHIYGIGKNASKAELANWLDVGE